MKFDALAPAASKENSFFSRGRTLRGRMALAQSGFVQIVGWGGRRGVNSRYQASTTKYYYYKQKGEA